MEGTRYWGFEDDETEHKPVDWRNIQQEDHFDAMIKGYFDFGRVEAKDEVALMEALTAQGIVKESVMPELDQDGNQIGETKNWEVRKAFRWDADVIDPATKVSSVKEIKLLPGVHLTTDENGALKHFNISFGR